MDTVAEFRVLLGVDVIDSASTAPHLLPQVPTVLKALLGAGMDVVGISRDDAVDTQYTGDGWLYAFPTALLGRVVDLGHALDGIVAEHNKWNKLELRLRLAVEVGPLPDGEGFHPSNITRARLLEAPAFKLLARRCIAARPDGAMSTAMIMSDAVYQPVFRSDYTKVARKGDYTELAVTNKEFKTGAWVAVPGFDARTLAAMIAEDQSAAAASSDKPARPGKTTNVVHGTVHNSVMADTIKGDVTIRGTGA
ncbi:hypothetical protein [Kutzneria sp. CA-103260]|uniref:hypothetical protein n=1 Tax=Kutzneria sp. CA-103260 TaxID=2802641 RepID=UPI001BAC47BE|nr:hypothetical protein [Kutzneria sp. CA-103260]QUQ66744.1 hypothetical protein JJ691_44720 [Kutzneria sp. CA-103260]